MVKSKSSSYNSSISCSTNSSSWINNSSISWISLQVGELIEDDVHTDPFATNFVESSAFEKRNTRVHEYTCTWPENWELSNTCVFFYSESIGIRRIHRLVIEEHIMSPNTKVLVLAHNYSLLLHKVVKVRTRRLKLRCNIEYVNIIKLEYFYLIVLNVRFYHEGIKYHMINAQFVPTIVRLRWSFQLSLQVRMLHQEEILL